jgi:hypothetical protein
MSRLKAAERKKMPASKFGLAKKRKYPVDTKGRARAAKSRAAHAEKTGRISKSEEKTIDAKANRKLGLKGSARKSSKKPASRRKKKAA